MTLTLLHADDSSPPLQTTVLPVLIGRSEGAHVRVGCRWASRIHCQIDQIDGQLVLKDLGSRYGTIVNGEPAQQVVLRSGDEIRVGLKRFVVALTEELIGRDQDSAANFGGEAHVSLSSG